MFNLAHTHQKKFRKCSGKFSSLSLHKRERQRLRENCAKFSRSQSVCRRVCVNAMMRFLVQGRNVVTMFEPIKIITLKISEKVELCASVSVYNCFYTTGYIKADVYNQSFRSMNFSLCFARSKLSESLQTFSFYLWSRKKTFIKVCCVFCVCILYNIYLVFLDLFCSSSSNGSSPSI